VLHRGFEAEIMLVCVRWHLRRPHSLEEIMVERHLGVDRRDDAAV
jgi:transposase-like protein